MGLLSPSLRHLRARKVRRYVGGDVLDLGCGSSATLELFGPTIRRYYGVDVELRTIERLRQRYPHARFIQKDLDVDPLDLPMEFDCILLLAVIEHIFNQKHLFSEVRKHLKPTGCIIVTTPTVFGNDIVHRIGSRLGLFDKQGGHDDHIVIYNRKRFDVLAKELGLRIQTYQKFQLGCNQLVVMRRE